MKIILPLVLVGAVLVGSSSTASAAGNMGLSVGGNVLLPMGDFGDAASTGFGGTVRGQYNVNPMFAVTLTTGYLIWSGKDQTVAGITIEGFDLKGVPLLVGGKYYFMPAGGARFYGIAELGLMFSTVTIPAQTFTIGGISFTTPEVSESSSDFTFSPGVGVEIPLGGGNSSLDLGAHYLSIGTSGSSSNSVGFRAAINFGLGN